MATYKLIQDIEAEDHILGPLTLRQFIFALIAAFLLYICFISLAKHVPVLLALFLPPALFCVFFAFPWGGDQPTEQWALAKLRFWFKPRRRIWNQSGIKELVTITAPKKVERVLTDNLSQTEVKSRLQALANTIDSRGWAIKHIDAVGYVPQQFGVDSDRLINIPDVQEVPAAEQAEDIMDAKSSPLARQFDNMISQSTRDYRQRLIDQLRQPVPQAAAAAPAAAQASQQWFMNHNPVPAAPAPSIPAAATVPAAASLSSAAAEPEITSLPQRSRSIPKEYGNLRTLQPLGSNQDASAASTPPIQDDPQVSDDASTAVTASSDPAILSLSKNNDLNVATLAREAQRAKGGNSQNEVVISLH